MRVDQLTEEEMVGIAQNVDNVLFSMTEITELSPLSVASIVLARVMWLTREGGCEEDFKNLLRKVADGEVTGPSRSNFIH